MKILKGISLSAVFIALIFVAFKTEIPSWASGTLLILNIGLIVIAIKADLWKGATIGLLYFTVIAGFLWDVPRLPILNETIRNQYFHVPLWFAMIILLFTSVVYSIKYLSKGNLNHDIIATELVNAGLLVGMLGITTGMIWAEYTWGKFWSGDPKQTYAAIGLLVYFAYSVLRGSFNNDIQKARISAVYNIFAFPALFVLLYILPRMAENSLHPGAQGNPAFSKYDLDANMRVVFYPSIFAWTLAGLWIANIRTRIKKLKIKIEDLD